MRLLCFLASVLSLVIAHSNAGLSETYIPSPGSPGFYAGNSSAAVTFDQYSLLLNGKRVMILSGEFHPWRLPSTLLWRDVLEKLKAEGFNAVSIYLHWGLTESKPGVLNFEGHRSVTTFLDIAKGVGILVIVRPGPYINAEIAGGGYPGWLSNVRDTAWSNRSDFTAAWKPYIQQVSKYVAPYEYPDGPFILMQSENEFTDWAQDVTTYGYTDHMKWIIDEMRANGITRVPITHNDRKPDGQFASGRAKVDLYAWDAYPLGFDCSNPEVWKQVDTTLDASHQKRNPAELLYLAEFQGGAFDPWGGPGYEACHQLINHQFANVFYKNNYAAGTSILNLYMTYGGTNWGNLATPTVYTSHDYAAPISEDRSLTLKYSEIKLQAMFLHATPHYLLAGRISNDTLHASLSYIFTTHLATLQGQNLYIIRQTSTTRTGLAEFDLRVNTTQGEVLLRAVTLDGRESKIIVSEYPFGASVLAYSSGEVATWTTFDGHDHIFLHASNSTTRTALYTRASTITASDPLFTATISNGTASIWIADKASTLALTGDLKPGTTELELVVPALVCFVTFKRRAVHVSRSPLGTLRGNITVEDPTPRLPNLTEFEWKCIDGSPEVGQFDDSDWVVANKTSTGRPTRFQSLGGKWVLFSAEYGFHHGHIVYRGRFDGNATGVQLVVQGGYNFGFSAFLNGQFLRSGQGRGAKDPDGGLDKVTVNYPFSEVLERENVLTVVVDNMGLEQDWNSKDEFKAPRGIRGYELFGGNFTSWKIAGAVDRGDTLRGPMNQGGLYVERIGATYPNYFTSSWPTCSPFVGIDRAGIQVYKTQFKLDIKQDADVPLAFRFERSEGNYRVILYVNDWQFGNFVANFGTQVVFPILEGVLNHRGMNDVVLIFWSLDAQGAKMNVQLLSTNAVASSKEVVRGLVA
ncbi:hypothetical protein RSOLAG22IIIB_08633 [Rhizoctonia solani]|uniref:beta-galactosidase n=1 Tax=Rhizoctonia solani TaxID=456999 RepID=A0A0K6FTX4_9AGAM|nr:hypothetical protein RSOLAG22IIIB_08633 [Rhizoctonia solani]